MERTVKKNFVYGVLTILGMALFVTSVGAKTLAQSESLESKLEEVVEKTEALSEKKAEETEESTAKKLEEEKSEAPEAEAAPTMMMQSAVSAEVAEAPEAEEAPVEEEVDEALRARIEALNAVFAFSIEEIDELLTKKRLTELTKEDSVYADYAAALITQLTENREHIALLEEELLDETVTSEAVRAHAASFKVWRSEVHDPLLKETIDLLLVDKGARSLAVAMKRLEKVEKDVVKIESLKSVEEGFFSEYVEKTRTAFTEARDAQLRAETLIAVRMVVEEEPAEDIDDEEVATKTAVAINEDVALIEEEELHEIREEVVGVMESLRAGYGELRTIGEIVKVMFAK